jgi:uncharacterized DUF497 family protein
MIFSWSPAKAATNRKKHGISFEEAATVFRDPLSATGRDPDHSFGQDRYITFGRSAKGRDLVVAHAEERDKMRIISARPMTRQERRLYEEGD